MCVLCSFKCSAQASQTQSQTYSASHYHEQRPWLMGSNPSIHLWRRRSISKKEKKKMWFRSGWRQEGGKSQKGRNSFIPQWWGWRLWEFGSFDSITGIFSFVFSLENTNKHDEDWRLVSRGRDEIDSLIILFSSNFLSTSHFQHVWGQILKWFYMFYWAELVSYQLAHVALLCLLKIIFF